MVAAARYSSPVWAVLIDLVIFAAYPGWHVVAGGALIVGAGLILIFLPARSQDSGPEPATTAPPR